MDKRSAFLPLLVCALALTCVSDPAHAQDADPATAPGKATATATGKPMATDVKPTLTGDWGGLRPKLLNDGIDIQAGYLGEIGSDVSGGRSRGTDYAQQLFFGVDWDLNKLVGWSGATLHTAVIDRIGNPLSLHTGSALEQNYIYGSGENFRVSELSLEQNLAGKRVNLKGGYVLVGLEFAATPEFCNFGFINNAFCAHPQYLGAGSGYQLGPVPQFGGRVRVSIGEQAYVEAGAFADNPRHLLPSKGFDLGLGGANGTIFPFEIGIKQTFADARLPGNVKAGGLYDTSDVSDVGNPLRTRRSRYVLWLLADKMVYRPDPTSHRGLTVFAQVGVADKAASPEPFWAAAGAVYQGPIASRPEDSVNLAWAHAQANQRGIDYRTSLALMQDVPPDAFAAAEDDVELSYNLQALDWLTVTPDLQYVIDPGAPQFSNYRNAAVLSLQVKAAF